MMRQRLVALGLCTTAFIFSSTSCAPTAQAPVITPTISPVMPAEVVTPVPTAMPTATPVPTSSPTSIPTITLTPSLPAPIPTATPTSTRAATIQTIHYDVVCSTRNDQAGQAYDDGVTLESQGKLEQAKASYANAIQLDGNYCDAMDNLAMLLRREGRLDDAINLYQRSIKASPDNVVAHNNLGLIYRLQGKADDAITEYRRVVQVAPDYVEGYFGLGSAYLDKQQPDQAIPNLKKAEDLYAALNSPLISDARYYLGYAYLLSRQFVKAKDYFELVSAQMKDDGPFNYYLGLCNLSPEVGDIQAARKYMTRAQQLGIPIPIEVQRMLDQSTAPAKTQTPSPQVGTPTAIALPLPTGQPVSSWNDIPIMPQAITGNEDKGVYSYTVKATIQQVQDFYDREMVKAGWRPFATTTGQTSAKIVMYQKDGKTASAFIFDQGDLVAVMLVLN